MHILTLLLAYSSFLHIYATQEHDNYFCPYEGNESLKISTILEQPWHISMTHKPHCEQLVTKRPTGLMFIFMPGVTKHNWKSLIQNETKLSNEHVSVSIYRTKTEFNDNWFPLEGCLDVPISAGKCSPNKCYDEPYLKVVLKTSNYDWVLPLDYAQQCSPGKCKNSKMSYDKPKGKYVGISTSVLQVNQIKEVIRYQTCYFNFSKETLMKEYNGNVSEIDSDPKHFGRLVLELSPELFDIPGFKSESHAMDISSCRLYPCKRMDFVIDSNDCPIYNHTFPDVDQNTLICFPWKRLEKSENTVILCMQSSRNSVPTSGPDVVTVLLDDMKKTKIRNLILVVVGSLVIAILCVSFILFHFKKYISQHKIKRKKISAKLEYRVQNNQRNEMVLTVG